MTQTSERGRRTFWPQTLTAPGWPLLGAMLAFGALFYLPLLYVLPLSVLDPDLTFRHFVRLWDTPVYVRVVLVTFRIAIVATVTTVVIGFPLSWVIARATEGWRAVLLGAVLFPFLTSILARTFAWIAILGQRGPVNAALVSSGVVEKPISLLFTEFAVVLALVQVSLPLLVLPLVAYMRGIDPRISLVAQSLGASPLQSFRRAIFPLTLPGLQTGSTLVFLYCLGSFITPAILGGRHEVMIGSLIESQVREGAEFGFAASLAIVLVIATLITLAASNALFRRWTRWQRPAEAPTPAPQRASYEVPASGASLLEGPAGKPRRSRLCGWIDRPDVLRRAGAIYGFVIVCFLILPLAIVVPISLSSSRFLVFPPPGLSLQYYEEVLGANGWIAAALLSAAIAIMVALLATTIGAVAAFAIDRGRMTGRASVQSFFMAPLAIPAIVFAIGAYGFYGRLHLVDTSVSIVLAHTVQTTPLALLVILASLRAIDRRTEFAAVSLGASRSQVLRLITLPLLRPGLTAAAMLSFLYSFDEAVIAIFLSGIRIETLPRKMYEGIRFEISPVIAAVSTLLITVVAIVLIVILIIQHRSKDRAKWTGYLI